MVSPKRLLAILLMTIGCLGSYVLIQKIVPLFATQLFILTLPGETSIPFVPSMIVVYTMIYVLPICMMLLVGKSRHFTIILDLFILVALVHFFFFLVMPVHYALRPNIAATSDNLFLQLIAVYYRCDQTTNCFPSMHVSYSFLSYFCIRRFRPEWANAFLIAASAIALSTLLVKQHYILDVVSAIALAAAADSLLKFSPLHSTAPSTSVTNILPAVPPSV